jgi:hypothetical protein
MMKSLLKQNVNISRPIWLGVSTVFFCILSRTIIVHKANDVYRIYHLWLWPFQAESYQGATVSDIVHGFSMIVLITSIILAFATLAGWLVAALFGSLKVIIKSENPTIEAPASK